MVTGGIWMVQELCRHHKNTLKRIKQDDLGMTGDTTSTQTSPGAEISHEYLKTTLAVLNNKHLEKGNISMNVRGNISCGENDRLPELLWPNGDEGLRHLAFYCRF